MCYLHVLYNINKQTNKNETNNLQHIEIKRFEANIYKVYKRSERKKKKLRMRTGNNYFIQDLWTIRFIYHIVHDVIFKENLWCIKCTTDRERKRKIQRE